VPQRLVEACPLEALCSYHAEEVVAAVLIDNALAPEVARVCAWRGKMEGM
jgi:hypothetical protein